MVDCVDGFPYANAKGNIGGFLVDGGVGLAGYLDQPASGAMENPSPNHFEHIWVDSWTEEQQLVWVEGTIPPASHNSFIEVDVQPQYEADYIWDTILDYRPTDGQPWVTADGVDYAFLILIKKDVGDVAFWLYDKTMEADLDDLLLGGEPGAAELESRLTAAVAAGKAIWQPAVFQNSMIYVVSVNTVREGATDAEFTLTLTQWDGVEETVLGPYGLATLDNITEFGGFDSSHPWFGHELGGMFSGYVNRIAEPRIIVPDFCPLADVLPVHVPVVATSDEPPECNLTVTSPDDDHPGPFLDTFKVSVPIGVAPDMFTLTIESVCDAPMTLAGIEWSAMLFNNSRRI